LWLLPVEAPQIRVEVTRVPELFLFAAARNCLGGGGIAIEETEFLQNGLQLSHYTYLCCQLIIFIDFWEN
jgi:hypothetical protein